MVDLNEIHLLRMTHINNIAHIVSYGITHASSHKTNPYFEPIGDGSLISSRSAFILPNGRTLGDYIPFYFGVRMPMLYVVQKGFNGVKITTAENIVYCISSVGLIVKHNLDFVFTDGHAVDLFSTFYNPPDVSKIKQLIDEKAIASKYWKDEKDLDLKRRKEAEFLVAGDIPISAIEGFAVYNTEAKAKLIGFGIQQDVIMIAPDFYF